MGVPSALRWQCRRGMLELDALLNHFLDREYEGLDSHQRRRFEALLQIDDPQLHHWLLVAPEAAPAAYRGIVARVRASAVQPSSASKV